jgi:hypothetical protein
MHGCRHLGSRPSAQNWTIPMFQLVCVMDNVPIATKLAMIDLNNIVDHLLCTLWIILDIFEGIHLFLSHFWTVCLISRWACPNTKQMKNTAPTLSCLPLLKHQARMLLAAIYAWWYHHSMMCKYTKCAISKLLKLHFLVHQFWWNFQILFMMVYI